ncbi:M14 family zinc carboxypeptidase [Flavobacteriales bacterium]|nr:M14 family zinc carboxypeptidase [Flavobacteriales bacterium]
MKKILFVLFIPFIGFSQNIDDLFSKKGEIYFSFKYENKNQINELSKIISIDHKTTAEIAYAYANEYEFAKFLQQGISYQLIEKKPLNYINNSKNNWDYYPTYTEYTNMMQAFTDSFPDICKLHHLGTLSSGREILILQISNNVGQKENEPSFLYTSSMHGDELAGYILSLRLADYILNGYGHNTRLTNLVNEIDIWINPLANPDGAYAGGNQDVWSATRYNANWVDLNRNYPDPEDGPHPDGNAYQTETNIFLGLSDTVNFTISANMHGGVEVCNYPWDTWSTLAADNNWWEYISHEYADSCQANSGNGYFNYLNDGITNGYDWYEVNGGRQDYMNYFRYCREFTLELSDDKTPDPNDLPALWDANYPSLLNYIEQSLFGLRGVVTDSITGNPLKAKVNISNHDIDSSHVYSNLPIGNYNRYLYQGNYDVTFSKSGYYPKIINTTILNNTSTIENVQLVPHNTTNIAEIKQVNKEGRSFDLMGKSINTTKGIQISEKGKTLIIE